MLTTVEIKIPYTKNEKNDLVAYWGADKFIAYCNDVDYLKQMLEDAIGCSVQLYPDTPDKVMSKEADTAGVSTPERSGGVKNDAGKPRADLLPSAALLEVAKVLNFGSIKYADNNWRKGFAWSRLYGAALRHILAHKDGENVDSESGLSHLSHAACCLLFLVEHELKGLGTDDRHMYEK